MTVIEFFDRESAVENIASALLCSPEKVVFIGGNSRLMKRRAENYKSVIESRGLKVDFQFKSVSRNNLDAIVDVLENVISENPDCVIDLSGGDELYLVAVGIIYEKYKDKVKLHRFNIRNNSAVDCDSDGNVCLTAPMVLSVDENIKIYGGRVIYTDEKPNSTYKWIFDSEFKADIYAMWDICKKNASLWNAQMNTVARLCNDNLNESKLTLSVNSDKIREKLFISKEIFTALEKAGIIKNLMLDGKFSFTFKNNQIMKCMIKSGQILELLIAVIADETEENGEPVYNSVLSGVYIDWDGIIQTDSRAEVENEMDVVLMKGMIPVFISCKNGVVDANELYKLSVVAERFGGKYVKKILVASQLDEMGYRAEYIRARAKDMGIILMEDVDSLPLEKMKKDISNLWNR